MAKPKGPKPNAFDMYCFASEYLTSAALLGEMHWTILERRRQDFHAALTLTPDEWRERQHLHLLAHVPGSISRHVLAALSLEIYLKCLHRIRGRHPPEHHKLTVIVDELSLRDRRAIRRRYLAAKGHMPLSSPDKRKPWTVSLESALIRAQKYFVQMRYGYEQPGLRGPFSGNPRDVGGDLGIPQAIEAVRGLIHEKHPDWEKAYLLRQRFD